MIADVTMTERACRRKRGTEKLDRPIVEQRRESEEVATPYDHRERLQQDRDADRRDQRCQARGVAQRPIGDALDDQTDGDAHRNRRQHADCQQQPTGCVDEHRLQKQNCRQRGQGPDHQHVAVRKVDQVQDPIDHRVAERDQRVHAAEYQAVDDLLQK